MIGGRVDQENWLDLGKGGVTKIWISGPSRHRINKTVIFVTPGYKFQNQNFSLITMSFFLLSASSLIGITVQLKHFTVRKTLEFGGKPNQISIRWLYRLVRN